MSVLLAEESAFVWVVSKSGPTAYHATALRAREVDRIVARLRRALDAGEVPLERFPEFDVAAAYQLYAELLKPVERAWKGAHTLIIVASGALGKLPFTVLPADTGAMAADTGLKFGRYGVVPWLVKQVAVTHLPSVSTLVTLRALPQGSGERARFIGFGDPQFGPGTPAVTQPALMSMRSAALARPEEGKAADRTPYSQLAPLPATREEILAIAAALKADPERDAFLGARATKENVKRTDLRTRRVVAFATHGLIPGDFPTLPCSLPTGRSRRVPRGSS